jgi:cell division transport system permease protein
MDNIIKNTLANVRRERLLSLTNIFTMTMTFLILGIFITVVVVSQSILRNLEQQAQVTIFFKDDFTEERILELENNLTQDQRIFSVNYISKEDAYRIFKEINKDDPVLLESVTSSILPASLEVRANDISDLPKLADEFKQLDGVEEVRFFEDVISRFRRFSTIAYAIGFALLFVFLLISYSVILSTLRTTINSKGTEYEIMKLVGATNEYVRKPLIYQGMFYGLISAFISGLLLVIIIAALNYFALIPGTFGLGFLANFTISSFLYSLVLWFVLILSGLLLGYFGSSYAVKRYLKY